jgi:hypothetical protein
VLGPVAAHVIGGMKIRIRTTDEKLTATVLENETARGFAALLPLTDSPGSIRVTIQPPEEGRS